MATATSSTGGWMVTPASPPILGQSLVGTPVWEAQVRAVSPPQPPPQAPHHRWGGQGRVSLFPGGHGAAWQGERPVPADGTSLGGPGTPPRSCHWGSLGPRVDWGGTFVGCGCLGFSSCPPILLLWPWPLLLPPRTLLLHRVSSSSSLPVDGSPLRPPVLGICFLVLLPACHSLTFSTRVSSALAAFQARHPLVMGVPGDDWPGTFTLHGWVDWPEPCQGAECSSTLVCPFPKGGGSEACWGRGEGGRALGRLPGHGTSCWLSGPSGAGTKSAGTIKGHSWYLLVLGKFQTMQVASRATLDWSQSFACWKVVYLKSSCPLFPCQSRCPR